MIENFAVFTQEGRWLVEEVSQVGGLFFEAGEVDGGHEFSNQCNSEQ